jgi:hypothetical protein
LRGKIALTLLVILVISIASLIGTALFVSAQQPPITPSSQSSELPNSSGPTQSPLSPTGPLSISANGTSKGPFGISLVANYTLPSRNLTINGTAFFWGAGVTAVMAYSIDGLENYTLPIEITPYFYVMVKISGSVVLPLLSAGDHSITVYANWAVKWADSAPNVPHIEVELAQVTLNFTVKAPVITVFSPENASYSSRDLSVNFTVDEPVSWVGYSLDNQGNVTFAENSTLTGLSYGNHTLIVYANDTAGVMGASQTVNFAVQASSEPFSLLIFIVVTAVLVVVIAAVGVAVFRWRRRASKPRRAYS